MNASVDHPGSKKGLDNSRFHPDNERGQSFVELALIIPVLIILLAGVVDLGRFYMAYMELRDAAQEGANYASLDPTNTTGIENHVKTLSTYPIDLAKDPDVTVSSSPITQTCGASTVTTSVVVTVNYHFKVTAPFVGIFFKDQIVDMWATATGKVLDAPC